MSKKKEIKVDIFRGFILVNDNYFDSMDSYPNMSESEVIEKVKKGHK